MDDTCIYRDVNPDGSIRDPIDWSDGQKLAELAMKRMKPDARRELREALARAE